MPNVQGTVYGFTGCTKQINLLDVRYVVKCEIELYTTIICATTKTTLFNKGRNTAFIYMTKTSTLNNILYRTGSI